MSSRDVRLVVAGGYDARVVENVEHQRELANEAEKLGLTHSLFPNMDGQVHPLTLSWIHRIVPVFFVNLCVHVCGSMCVRVCCVCLCVWMCV